MADARSDLWQTNWPINPRKLVRCSLPVSIPGRTDWRTALRKCKRTACWGAQPPLRTLRSACCAPYKEVCFSRKPRAVKNRSRLHSIWRSITWRATADHWRVHPTPRNQIRLRDDAFDRLCRKHCKTTLNHNLQIARSSLAPEVPTGAARLCVSDTGMPGDLLSGGRGSQEKPVDRYWPGASDCQPQEQCKVLRFVEAK